MLLPLVIYCCWILCVCVSVCCVMCRVCCVGGSAFMLCTHIHMLEVCVGVSTLYWYRRRYAALVLVSVSDSAPPPPPMTCLFQGVAATTQNHAQVRDKFMIMTTRMS